MASLKGIPTKCRFAVLDVSDDGDEEKSGVGENAGNAKKADANNATKAKKKRKKKKNKAKNEQTNPESDQGNERQGTGENVEWVDWMQKDEEVAIAASKQDKQQNIQTQQISLKNPSIAEMSQENKQEKRKKDIVMSLDEFNMHYTTDRNIDSEKPEKLPSETKFDDFSYLQDIEEKPLVSGKVKLLTASHEDQIHAEMVDIKDELDRTGHELVELRKAKDEHLQIIEDLKTELSQVKRRNKQLCFILSQAEMKEKSELLMQIEELNEVKEQVVQLHAELEQERSKNSTLKTEMAKEGNKDMAHHPSKIM
ncbi:G kinase-anchoring protein 1 [Acropora cervicornis]|uniref:G kinase-anchoring protein 1 n=1 Tax=Acropora cervicornis TaxID=6130 RepID=A0AAD9QN64_ACRCE|nr:G kinase-anchoring protein 1 [Acropora cervicornis]